MKSISARKVFEINKVWHKYESEFYDSAYQNFFLKPTEIWEKFAKLYMNSGALKVMDFGCGTGFVSRIIIPYLNKNSRIFLVDSSREMLNIASQNVKFKKTKKVLVLDKDFSVNNQLDSFDIICVNGVLHHIKNVESLFERFRIWLRPGGLLLIVHEPHLGFSGILNRITFLKPISKAICRKSKKIDPLFVANVNEELKREGLSKGWLTENELLSIVDYGNRQENQLYKTRYALNKQFFKRQKGFVVKEHGKYTSLRNPKNCRAGFIDFFLNRNNLQYCVLECVR